MTDKPWKQAERDAAALFNGKRFPANTGAEIDFEGPEFVGQVKNVQRMSLTEIGKLAVDAEKAGKRLGKIGVLTVKQRAGHGNHSPRLVVMTEDAWRTVLERAGNRGKGDQGRHD